MLIKQMAAGMAVLFMALAALSTADCHAQAALLMEQPYGLYGILNPTGHNAIYLQNVCAETPLQVRRCRPGELGSVISRYEGVDGYDWLAIPLIPYLYAVDDASQVPARVDRESVNKMRARYREAYLHPLGLDQSGGSFVRDGWTQLIGAAYQRRIYAYRFETTRAQDDALIAWLNGDANHSHFHMLFRNCADFAREVLNQYFPRSFRRSIFPDAGVTTPKQITYKLVRYARKHPEVKLTVLEIPQVPGYRIASRSNKDIAESFSTTAYAIPLTLVNPYLFGGIFVDYLVRGRYHLVPKHPEVVDAEHITELTVPPAPVDNAAVAGAQVSGAASADPAPSQTAMGANSGLQEGKAAQ